jgi:hypothetical protein
VYGTVHGSDHKPIETRFDLAVDIPQNCRRRLQFQKTDWKAIRHAIEMRLPPSDVPDKITEDELEKSAVHFVGVVAEEIQ